MLTKEVIPFGNLTVVDKMRARRQHEMREGVIFGLALALATEPSKLPLLRQLLEQLQELQVLPLGFSTWARERIDERVMALALPSCSLFRMV